MQQFKRNQQHSKQPTTYTATQVHSSAWTQLGKENAGAAVLVNAASYNSNIKQRDSRYSHIPQNA